MRLPERSYAQYVERHGNKDWEHQTIYGTGEPCPMCMTAMIWAGLTSVVYASETPLVSKYVNNINIRATDVVAAANPALYKSKLLLGGVLSDVTDKMFEDESKKNPFFAKVLASQREFARRVVPHVARLQPELGPIVEHYWKK